LDELVEAGEVLDLVVGDGFEGAAGFGPGAEASVDDLGPAVLLVHHVGDADAGGLADAGAVEVDLALGGHELAEGDELLLEAVGFNADGVLDALHAGIVVAVAADVGDDDEAVGVLGLEAFVEVGGGDPFDAGEAARAEVEDEPADGIEDDEGKGDDEDDVAGLRDSELDLVDEAAEEVSGEYPGGGVGDGSDCVEREEAGEAHVERAGEGGGHGSEAGDELGEEEGAGAAAVEVVGGAEDALLGVGGEAAEDGEEPPAGEAAAEEEEGIAGDGGDPDEGEEVEEAEVSTVGCGSGNEEND